VQTPLVSGFSKPCQDIHSTFDTLGNPSICAWDPENNEADLTYEIEVLRRFASKLWSTVHATVDVHLRMP
jgi:hypothetical protein